MGHPLFLYINRLVITCQTATATCEHTEEDEDGSAESDQVADASQVVACVFWGSITVIAAAD